MSDNMKYPTGMEKAVVGMTLPQPDKEATLILDYKKCIDILVERDGMSADEADEFMQYNVVGAYVGTGTPSFLLPGRMEEGNFVDG